MWSADPQGEVAGEDDVALVRVGEVVVAVREDRLAVGVVGGDGLVCVVEGVQGRGDLHEVVVDALVVHDLAGAAEVVVAEDVVDVVLGVDDVADLALGLGLLAHGDRLGGQLRGVDDDDTVVGDDHAGVATAKRGVGPDVARDLLHRSSPSVVVARRQPTRIVRMLVNSVAPASPSSRP